MDDVQTSGRAHSPMETANLRLVLEFYDAILNRQQWERLDEFVDPGYLQHKPDAADGPAGLREFVQGVYRQSPRHRVRIVRALVDGDFVTLHVNVLHAVEAPSLAVMDIFRIRNGRLVEHWDVAQPVPTTGLRNANGMF